MGPLVPRGVPMGLGIRIFPELQPPIVLPLVLQIVLVLTHARDPEEFPVRLRMHNQGGLLHKIVLCISRGSRGCPPPHLCMSKDPQDSMLSFLHFSQLGNQFIRFNV